MSHDEINRSISNHYGWSCLMESVEQEIRLNGIDPQQVTVDQLAPVDNYHWFRPAGTLAVTPLAVITGAERDMRVEMPNQCLHVRSLTIRWPATILVDCKQSYSTSTWRSGKV
jgi:hypothetical protein